MNTISYKLDNDSFINISAVNDEDIIKIKGHRLYLKFNLEMIFDVDSNKEDTSNLKLYECLDCECRVQQQAAVVSEEDIDEICADVKWKRLLK